MNACILCTGCTFSSCEGEVAARARRRRLLTERPDICCSSCCQVHIICSLTVFGSTFNCLRFVQSCSPCQIRKQGTILSRKYRYLIISKARFCCASYCSRCSDYATGCVVRGLIPGRIFLVSKISDLPEHEADHSPQSGSEVKNECSMSLL